jgi:site-specific DNA recombinase
MRAARTAHQPPQKSTTPKPIRAAVYCRQSVADDLEFGSLESQSQAIRSYIDSQRAQGWKALPEDYVDRGFSGKNTDRPAFKQMLKDIEAGKIDLVAVHRYDRISRSLLDFLQILRFFDKHGVHFVSVTQNFDTSSSAGRLLLNMLASFAEFERQMISERTAEKMAATRKKGMWTGGRPVLGYDVKDKKLLINDEEAEQVSKIYQLYLDRGSLLSVVEEVNRRGWRNKTHIARTSRICGGSPFDKNSIRRILTHPIYAGKVLFEGEIYEGEHEAIVKQGIWDSVQAQLEKHRGRSGNGRKPNGRALLGRILRCGSCGASFSHNSTGSGNRRYRYYVCQTLQKKGKTACPDGRVSAPEIEQFVVEKIMAIGKDPKLVAKTCRAARMALEKQKTSLAAETKRLDRKIRGLAEERDNLLDAVAKGGKGAKAIRERLAKVDEDLQGRTQAAEEARRKSATTETASIDEDDLSAVLASFTPVWDELFPQERSRVLHLLIEQVTYNAKEGKVQISFRPGGVRTLAAEHEEIQT